jgi:membrane-associated phospholipid phosphatase
LKAGVWVVTNPRSGSRGTGVGALALVLALWATPAAAGSSLTPQEPLAAAQETSGPPPPPSLEASDSEGARPPQKDGRRTLRRFPANFARTTIGVFHRDNLVPLALGATATAIGSAYDERVRDSIPSEGDDLTATLSTLFGGIEGVALVGSVLAAGRLARGQRFRDATYDMAVAAGVSVTYTFALKYAVGRERPNGENNQSFPSGHTSNAFALAAALDGHYGKKVTIPAYTLAALVGYARLSDKVHWLSDVLAGATLGYIVGRTTVRVNNAPLEGVGVVVSVSPLLGRDVRGVRVTIAF